MFRLPSRPRAPGDGKQIRAALIVFEMSTRPSTRAGRKPEAGSKLKGRRARSLIFSLLRPLVVSAGI
jgi:hypothetical protein